MYICQPLWWVLPRSQCQGLASGTGSGRPNCVRSLSGTGRLWTAQSYFRRPEGRRRHRKGVDRAENSLTPQSASCSGDPELKSRPGGRLTWVFHGVSQSLQANTGIVPLYVTTAFFQMLFSSPSSALHGLDSSLFLLRSHFYAVSLWFVTKCKFWECVVHFVQVG
jgi:hypothetical protein